MAVPCFRLSHRPQIKIHIGGSLIGSGDICPYGFIRQESVANSENKFANNGFVCVFVREVIERRYKLFLKS